MRHICVIISLLLSSLALHSHPLRVYHDSLTGLQRDTLITLIPASDRPDRYRAVEIRFSLPSSSASKTGAAAGVVWNMTDSHTYNYAIIENAGPTFDDLTERPAMILNEGHIDNGVVIARPPVRIDKDINTNGGENSLAVEITGTDVSILAGHKALSEIAAQASGDCAGAMGILVRGQVSFNMAVSERIADQRHELSSQWNRPAIDNYFSSSLRPAPEGVWRYLDRDNDPRFARPGGYYELAIVANHQTGGYDIIYLDGANTASSLWEPGMLKGRLSPTAFSGHFDLQWFDASMQLIDSECSATIESSAILRLDFPLLKSSMRFSLLRQDK